jgi:FkbM family methyltransferase
MGLSSFMADLHRKLVRRFDIPRLLNACTMLVGDAAFMIPKTNGYMCEPGEPWMLDLVQALAPQRPGVFLDVGVNLGQTLLMFKSTSSTSPYVGLEPNPLCVAYVDYLAKLNGFDNYGVIPVGLGRESGILKLQFFHGQSVDSSASLVPNFRPEQPVSHTMYVPVFPYSEIERAANLEKLGIVKIDVEGAEGDVLMSMAQALRRDQPIILVEILPCYDDQNKERIARQRSIEKLMHDLDYTMYRILKSTDGRFQSLQCIPEIGIHADIALSDYLFCPKSELARLSQLLAVV